MSPALDCPPVRCVGCHRHHWEVLNCSSKYLGVLLKAGHISHISDDLHFRNSLVVLRKMCKMLGSWLIFHFLLFAFVILFLLIFLFSSFRCKKRTRIRNHYCSISTNPLKSPWAVAAPPLPLHPLYICRRCFWPTASPNGPRTSWAMRKLGGSPPLVIPRLWLRLEPLGHWRLPATASSPPLTSPSPFPSPPLPLLLSRVWRGPITGDWWWWRPKPRQPANICFQTPREAVVIFERKGEIRVGKWFGDVENILVKGRDWGSGDC